MSMYSYSTPESRHNSTVPMPYLPLTLELQGQTLTVLGLLDTGATVNVLPYSLGIQLGAVWQPHGTSVRLGGNLAQFDAQPLIVMATIEGFAPVRLVYAWTRAEEVPVILGQVNFFLEFDVCFYGARHYFEIQPKQN